MKPILFIAALFSLQINAQIVTIPDANFKYTLLNTICVDTDGDGTADTDADFNDDGEIQISEAESIVWLDVGKAYNTPNSEKISSIEGIQSFTNIEFLDCEFNLLSSVDVTQNANLLQLILDDNNLESVDVSQNQNLLALSINTNSLSYLDVAQNTNLVFLVCQANLIEEIDLSQNTNLEWFACAQNPFLTSLNLKSGNNVVLTYMSANDNPSLECIQVDDVDYAINAGGWFIDQTAYFSEDCSLGIEEHVNSDPKLYPNPAHNMLFIQSAQPIEGVQFYNLNGQLLKEDFCNSIDISNLPKGFYLVQISIQNKTITKKLIKD